MIHDEQNKNKNNFYRYKLSKLSCSVCNPPANFLRGAYLVYKAINSGCIGGTIAQKAKVAHTDSLSFTTRHQDDQVKRATGSNITCTKNITVFVQK